VPFDASRVDNNEGAIQGHLTDFAAGVTSVDEWEIVHEQQNGSNVVVVIQYSQ